MPGNIIRAGCWTIEVGSEGENGVFLIPQRYSYVVIYPALLSDRHTSLPCSCCVPFIRKSVYIK